MALLLEEVRITYNGKLKRRNTYKMGNFFEDQLNSDQNLVFFQIMCVNKSWFTQRITLIRLLL